MNKFWICILFVLGSFFFFSHSAYATDISISNSGKVSFGKVQPSSVGTLVTGEDSLSISTTCAEGVNIYATSVNGNDTGTSLVNLAAKAQDTEGTNAASYTINTSSATIGSATALTDNTWGLNTNASEAGNGLYYGLPAFSDSTTPTAIYTGAGSSIPVYFGAKVTNALATGTYNGQVLYTATVNTACLNYTVTFDKNAESATGSMESQTILPAGGSLRVNSFEYPGYTFLGWSTNPAGKTGTATNGIGTEADVEYGNTAIFPDSTISPNIEPGDSVTLYAIWKKNLPSMQNWTSCAKLAEGETITLVDSRDGNEYTVKKFGSGSDAECWMTSNLTLGYDQATSTPKGLALTSADTNIPADDTATYYLPPAGYMGSTTSSSTTTSTTAANFNGSNETYAKVQYAAASATGSTNPQPTGYYNFNAASLGSSYYGGGTSSGNVPRDICPKGWQLPRGSSTATYSFYWLDKALGGTGANRTDTTTRDRYISDFALPYFGYYINSSLDYVGSDGYWWSSTVNNSILSYSLSVNSSGYLRPQYDYDKHRGFAVRCVAQPVNYMQDFNPNSLADGESTTLVDARDGNRYTVKKFGSGADAEVWMTSNLTLGYDQATGTPKGLALTNADTNIPASDSTTYYLPPAGKRGSVTSSSTVTATNTATFNTSNVSEAQVQYRAAGQVGDADSTGTLFQNTGYYNYPAATLGYFYYNDGKSSGDSPRDICPAGWQLPRGSSTSTYSFYWLDTTLGGTGTNRTDTTTRDKFLNDASFGYSGYYSSSQLYYVGSHGSWWSSTLRSSTRAYGMYLGSDGSVYPQSNSNKYFGFSIRCIAKEPTMQDFNPSSLAEGEITTLTDTRDNHKYKVKKLPDGKVWMINNLTLTATDLVTEGKALTNANTNIPSSDTNSYYITPKNARYTSTGSFNNSAVASASASVDFSSSYSNYIQIGYRDKNTTDNDAGNPVPEDTAYYNFYTATLGYSYYNDDKASGSSTMDICPKGWRLPKVSDNGTSITAASSEFANLARAYNGSASWTNANTAYTYYTSDSTIRQNMIKGDASSLDPELDTNGSAGFTYAGYYGSTTLNGVGTRGRYWSSSVYDSIYGYYLFFNASNVYPQNHSYKYSGNAVRCVAQ